MWVLSGCSFTVRADTLRAAGGFAVAAISEDGHTTWRLYRAGAKLTYTPAAIAYTMEPQTWRTWRRQQLRWASGFFQIQRAYWQEFRHPAVLLVIGGMLLDLVLLPVTYTATVWAAVTGRLEVGPLLLWLVGFNASTIAVAATVIGPRRALMNFFPHKVVALATTATYLGCGLREWGLGRHLTTWTGRQGRPAVITPMTQRRKTGLTYAGLAAAVTAVLFSF